MEYRIEKDSMGKIKVPATKYWGAQTQRASENFNISPLRIHPTMITSLALVKKHAALANKKLGLIPDEIAEKIVTSADEVIVGMFNDNFPIDVMQTGSGTSWNMNMNEVIANRSNELFGLDRNSEDYMQQRKVHPNDHVNKGQSSNDSIPTAIYIACRLELDDCLLSLSSLANCFEAKGEEFKDVIKIGRTHLQDAVPMTVRQEFHAFADQIRFSFNQLKRLQEDFLDIPQGGTAVGTGLNCHQDFPKEFVSSLSEGTNLKFRSLYCKFVRMAGAEPFVALMGAMSTLSCTLIKVANDIRLLSSGPRTAISELVLPELQPGSSIMPGKINPVILEMAIQSAAHMIGKAESVRIAAQNGPLQLIMMFPLIAHECLTTLELARKTCTALEKRCIQGIKIDKEQANFWLERSLALVTPLAVRLGYDKAAYLSHKAYHENRTLRSVIIEDGCIDVSEIDTLLDPKTMIYSC